MKITGLVVAVAVAVVITVPWMPVTTIEDKPAATVSRMTTAQAPRSTVPGQFRGLAFNQEHTGFPTVTKLPDGRLRLMWRHGSSHASGDGEILTSVSADDGETWGPAQHVTVDNGPGSPDAFAGPSGLSTVGNEVFLTYFVTVNGVPSGARLARSTDGGETFGSSVRIDPGFPWAAISAPVIKVNGKLWTAIYARPQGDTVESAYAAWSEDNGLSWEVIRIAIGTSGNPFQEPWAVAGANNSVVFVMRDGNWKSLASRNISSTGTWSPIYRNVLANATGSNASVRAANGRIYTVYRDTVTRAAKLASSGDNGLTWTVERELMPKPAGAPAGSVGMTYAHPIELGVGRIFCPMGMEFSNTDSRLYAGWL